MATIKAYTDISQSKKLAEILPFESVDMVYICIDMGRKWINVPRFIEGVPDHTDDYDIPCWSLAALVGILPRSIEFKGDKYYLNFMKDYVEYANNEVSITGRCLHTTGNNNLVDACVEMIERLHKLNLL